MKEKIRTALKTAYCLVILIGMVIAGVAIGGDA